MIQKYDKSDTVYQRIAHGLATIRFFIFI